MANKKAADALQWVIDLADKQQPRGERSQEERHYLYDLENLKTDCQGGDRYRPYKKPA